ncbi:MAG: ferredoxin, partial [Actinobacteria bacterium]
MWDGGASRRCAHCASRRCATASRSSGSRRLPETLAVSKVGRVKVRVDSDTCVGHGRCYVLAPEVFGPDEYGHSEVLLDEVPPEL